MASSANRTGLPIHFRGTTTVNFCEAYYNLPTYCKKDIFTKEGMLAHEWTHAFWFLRLIMFTAQINARIWLKNLLKKLLIMVTVIGFITVTATELSQPLEAKNIRTLHATP